MKEILETIILNLVKDKETVQVNEKVNGKSVAFEVKVAKADMGRVIGRQGKLARSIRTLMKAMAVVEQKNVTVEFVE